jgi:hypothetical protein
MPVDIEKIKLSAQEKQAIKDQDPTTIPLDPTAAGWSGEQVRARQAASITAEEGSVLSELDEKTELIHDKFVEVDAAVIARDNQVSTNVTNIQTNANDIDALETGKLSRDGSQPMLGDLDMDDHQILNANIEATNILVNDVNVQNIIDDVDGLKDGTVRAKKAENTDDGAGHANTAEQINDTVANVNQDVKDDSTPTFAGVTIGDKTLTNQKLADLDAAKAHADIITGNPHQLDKADIGLPNVDNTSDLNKPISTATQTALDGKADLEGGFVKANQLPSYVDDIVEFATLQDLQNAGKVVSKIYVVTNDPTPANNTSYRITSNGTLVKFDHTSAEWGHVTGTITNQTDIENATFTPDSSGITSTTVKTAIQEVKGYAKGIKQGTTPIDFLDADLAATNIAAAISEVQDNLDDVVDGTQNITYGQTTVAATLGDLQSRVSTAEGNISSNDTDISGLDGRLTTAEGDIDTLETDVANIVNGTTNITYGATTVAGELSSLDGRLDTAETDISNIEDGTTNITFDPASSGLDSTTLEGAIKEIYAEKGANNGIATLDNTGRLPASQLTLEAVSFKGTFGSASSTTQGDLPSSEVTTGDLYICDTNNYASSVSGITFNNGDKALFDGSAWRKNDAFDAVTSVNTQTGAVQIDAADVPTDTTSFNGFLNNTHTTVQQALDNYDNHVHTFAQVTEKPTTIDGFGITDAYTKTQLDSGQLDNQYYTETELNNGQLDTRYYTELELDNFLADKLDVSALASSLILYPTTAASDIASYNRLVTDPSDLNYNITAANVETPNINGQGILAGELIADANLFVGNPGIINVPIVGQIRKTSNNPNANAVFYFEIHKRDAQGNEVLLATSDVTKTVTNTTYQEFNASALLNNGIFLDTDRVVLKFYGNSVGNEGATYEFQFGGATPVRALFNIPISATLQANRVTYNNVDSTLDATNVKVAIDELDQKILDSLTTIRVEQFVIVNPDLGDGTFSYKNGNDQTKIGAYDGTWRTFALEVAGFYENNNLVEASINDSTIYHTTDTDQLEEGVSDSEGIVTSVKVAHNFIANDEVDFRYYQGVSIMAQQIGDSSVSYSKLDTNLKAKADDVTNATSSNTANTLVKRNASGEFAGVIDGRFKTARTIALDGDVSGQANFDGSTGITITTVVADDSHSHTTFAGNGLSYNATNFNYDINFATTQNAIDATLDNVSMTPAKVKTYVDNSTIDGGTF